MALPLTQKTKLTISHDDLTAILTEYFCASYTPFRDMRVIMVHMDTVNGSCSIEFVIAPEEEA